MERKLKVVWLCHLTNEALNKYFGIEKNMSAYWMTQFVDIVKDYNVEIHVVSPNYYTNRTVSFEIGGVSFHFYRYYSGFGGDRYSLVELAINKGYFLKREVRKIIDKIKPDLVHLFGAENITYSQAILPYLNTIPTVVSFQGYVQLAEKKGNFIRNWVLACRARTEDVILRECPNVTFGEFETQSRNYYLRKYGKGEMFTLNFPFKLPNIDATKQEKEYDIVFWGRVTVDKGVEDLINAVALIKVKKPSIKCMILGGGSSVYTDKLKMMVEQQSLTDNIIFGGFQKTNEVLFKMASKAIVYVLPTHYDALPGSIRESMYMKLPVISYPVGDIPALNKDTECVVLADYQNVENLAMRINNVLDDEPYRQKLIDNAYACVATSSSNEVIGNQFIGLYEAIVNKK